MDTNLRIEHFDKKFGVITPQQLILTQGASHDHIALESIDYVNLIKYRVLFTNAILLIFSCMLLFFSAFILNAEKIKIYGLLLIGFAILIFAIVHKFHFYRLVIKENNNTVHVIETSQINRKCIKQFYILLIKKIGKKNKRKNTILQEA
jgi:hypothetical protein